MIRVLFLSSLILLVACQAPKGLAGTYRIRITPDLAEEFAKADRTVADAWKTNKEQAEQMAINHPRRVIESQRLEIRADGTYRYFGSYGGEDTVIEGEAKLVGDELTLTAKTRNGAASEELGLMPQVYKYDPEVQTLTIQVADAPMVWAK